MKKIIIALMILFSIAAYAGAQELWLSVGSGIGFLPGEFSLVSLLNIDGTIGLGIHRLFNTPLRSDVEITYAGFLPSQDSSGWISGMHGIQGVLLISFQGELGKSIILTPRAGAGVQLLFTSSAATNADYQAGVYTTRFGSQMLIQGGLAFDFLLSEDWALGVEGDYRLLIESAGLHHGALVKIVLNRKIADFKRKTEKPESTAPIADQLPTDTPPETIPLIDLSPLQGIDNIHAFQSGKLVTIILQNSFLPYESEITEPAQKHLALIGEVMQSIHLKTVGFFGYVAEVQEDEEELDKELSLSRAEAIRDWLFSNGHLKDLTKTKVQGRSNSNPIADNSTSEGRARNRRVEIIITID